MRIYTSKSLIEFIGQKFGRWTFLEDLGYVGKRKIVKVKCDCGIIKDVRWDQIKNGSSQSCGCFKSDSMSKLFKKHGLTDHPIRAAWRGMIRRCYNEDFLSYASYGAKGVQVCDEWRYSLENFFNWCISNGWTDGLQVDKDIIPKSLGFEGRLYCPEFCCLVTSKENNQYRSNNRIITHLGESLSVSQLADRFDINYGTFLKRLKLGWDIDKIVSTPIDKKFSTKKKKILC